MVELDLMARLRESLSEEEAGRLDAAMEDAPRAPSPIVPYAKSRKTVLAQQLAKVQRRLAQVQTESIRLAVPLRHLESFFASRQQVRILSGSNQSAKTYHAVLEAARAVLGRDPYGKYPKENGRAILVGYDNDHLNDPLYKKLFEPGEFYLVRDEETKKWRSVRPDPNDPQMIDPYDLSVREKWKEAPPLIPPRMVVEHKWEVSNRIPRSTTLTNGWQILWRSSNSRPPRGRQIHFALLDEDLRNTNGWVNEMIPRLVKHGGRMVWAATAQEGGPELDDLIRKAETGSEHIGFWRLLITDNPFISDEQREFFRSALTTEEDLAVRYYGETAFSQKRVYRDYDPNGIHGCEPFSIPTDKWARYVILDPGRKHCGTIFLAVDPEERHAWVYEALDLRNSDAIRWAHEVAVREHGMKFEAFIIDQQMGKETHVGREYLKNVARQYWNALVEAGVTPRRLGGEPALGGFFPGSNNIEAREEALIGWMSPRPTSSPFAGTPKLQVMRGMSPELDRQIRIAQTDEHGKRVQSIKQDILVCLEYASAFEPGYHEPEPSRVPEVSLPITPWDRLQQKKKRVRRKRGGAQRFGSSLEMGGY
jgi:hypothetical protein